MATLKLNNGHRVTSDNPYQNVGYKVTFLSTPTNALYTVNNVNYGHGQVGSFNPGTYYYTISASGYYDKTGTFTVSDRNIAVSETLTVASAQDYSITFNLNPAYAIVVVNGVTYTNGQSASLSGGVHSYTASASGHRTSTASFNVSANAILGITPQTETAAASPATVNFSSSPTGARVIFDDVDRGVTPLTVNNVTSGVVHNYYLTMSGYKTYQSSITPTSGSTTQVHAAMEVLVPPYGTYLGDVCSGVDKYARYADGNGGSYQLLSERNSPSCGYTPPQEAVLQIRTDVAGKVLSVQNSDTAEIVYTGTTPFSAVVSPGNYHIIRAKTLDDDNSDFRVVNGYVPIAVAIGETRALTIPLSLKIISDKSYTYRIASTVNAYCNTDVEIFNRALVYTHYGNRSGGGGNYYMDYPTLGTALYTNSSATKVAFTPADFTVQYIKNAQIINRYHGNTSADSSMTWDATKALSRTDSTVFFMSDSMVYIDVQVTCTGYSWT